MFTGIVDSVGRIASVVSGSDGMRIVIEAATLDLGDVSIGDSMAVNGCCLTVVDIAGATMRFDVSAETLSCTNGLDRPGRVNLEKSLRMGERLGGHLMTGHVDGVGAVARFARATAGSNALLEVDVPDELAHLVARKGSIAVDGVSLTINAISGSRFSANLIPHTLEATTLGGLSPGARVNLEVDLIARYVERLHQAPR